MFKVPGNTLKIKLLDYEKYILLLKDPSQDKTCDQINRDFSLNRVQIKEGVLFCHYLLKPRVEPLQIEHDGIVTL